MTEKFKSSITSDKIETDNRDFATVKADQMCEEALIPRKESFRQLKWDVTLEKGVVYKPQEDIGIYARSIDCKYGVQVASDIFGRENIKLTHGGAAHSGLESDGEEPSVVGTRVLGSVASEGTIEIVEPTSKADDWEGRPVTVYGDIIGKQVTVDEPLVVYGNIIAEKALRIDAPTVVLGEARSEGTLEASDILALTISAEDDIVLGKNVITVNPVIQSAEGQITFANNVGLLDSDTLARIQDENDIERISMGPWLFDQGTIWDSGVLVDEDIMSAGEGEVATRTWRTVTEPQEEYAYIQALIEKQVYAFRKNPPEIEQFRYAGLTSLDEVDSEAGVKIHHDGDGDVVIGSQEKKVQEEEYTKIDSSQTAIDKSTEIHDSSTSVDDSVVNRADIGNEKQTPEVTAETRTAETSGKADETSNDVDQTMALTEVENLNEEKVEILLDAGYESVADVAEATEEELQAIDGIDFADMWVLTNISDYT